MGSKHVGRAPGKMENIDVAPEKEKVTTTFTQVETPADSFEGLPAKTKEDSSAAGDQFKAGELLVTKREVIEKFKRCGLKIPRIRKGFFEDLNPDEDVPEKISYAFLDGDLYTSIKTSLKLSQKASGARILVVPSHSSNSCINNMAIIQRGT